MRVYRKTQIPLVDLKNLLEDILSGHTDSFTVYFKVAEIQSCL